MTILNVTDATFDAEVLKSDKPVLVDFWAPWCGPCKRLGPVLEEMAAEREDVKIVKINVDENPETAKIYAVKSLPTMLSFKDGKAMGHMLGSKPKDKIMGWLDKTTAKDAAEGMTPDQLKESMEESEKQEIKDLAKNFASLAKGAQVAGLVLQAGVITGGIILATTAATTLPLVLGAGAIASGLLGSAMIGKNWGKIQDKVADSMAETDDEKLARSREMLGTRKNLVQNGLKVAANFGLAVCVAGAGIGLIATTGSFLVGALGVGMLAFGGVKTAASGIGLLALPLAGVMVRLLDKADAKKAGGQKNAPEPALTATGPQPDSKLDQVDPAGTDFKAAADKTPDADNDNKPPAAAPKVNAPKQA